ncbi:MAG: Bifunctional adenosylcobalamin biosynthesis protein CobP [Anaerolineales bacterium]|nr:Bifunctional adenosylcobalamin biosynthesis protein CobP [Anaerolineales bacterium]
MGHLTLVLGGARSGKSTFAEQRAQELGGERQEYFFPAGAGDEEMQQRIERHRRERPSGWRTLEVQRDVGRAILGHAGGEKVFLVDCLTILVSNLLIEAEDPFAPGVGDSVAGEIDGLTASADELTGHLIVVSNEVGLGLVPAYPLGRAYRDLLGWANQALAQRADEVYFLVAGLRQKLK